MNGLYKRGLISILVSWIVGTLCFAAGERVTVRFERFSGRGGLSQNTVMTILQDHMGFLWLGTEDGLNRYDGYTFKVYKHNPDDPSSISRSHILSLYEDEKGVLWVGTKEGGLNRYNRENETFTRFVHSPDDKTSIDNNTVFCITGGGDGYLWVGTGSGLNRLNKKTGVFKHFCDGIRVKVIYPESTGVLWLGTQKNGLIRFEGKIEEKVPDSKGDNILSICEDNAGILWIGTAKGLKRFDPGTRKFIQRKGEWDKPGLPSGNAVPSVYRDIKGRIWAGTWATGLFCIAPETKRVAVYSNNSSDPYSLSNNDIQHIYQDRSGVLWVGTNTGGLNKYDTKRDRFGLYTFDRDNCVVWSFYKEPEGSSWIGTENGVIRLDRDRRGTSTVLLEGKKIMAILADTERTLWFGSAGNGVFLYDRKTGRTTNYKEGEAITVLFKDADGFVWVGTKNGLYRRNGLDNPFIEYTHDQKNSLSISNNSIRTIFQDRAGTLWIGTEGGLNRFHKDTGTITRWRQVPGNPDSLSYNNVSAIREDKDGSLWVGTSGGGLNRFDPKTGVFAHYLEKDGLPNNIVNAILADKEDFFWISTNRGLARFDPLAKPIIFKQYDIGDGLQDNEFNHGAAFRSSDGEMFFGGPRGFNAFYPAKITDNPYIAPVVITGFEILNRPVEIGVPGSPLEQSITQTSEIELTDKDYYFTFEFSVLDFSNPYKNRFQYMMEGLDRDWVQGDAQRRFATYTNLDADRYVFRVRGYNSDGVGGIKGTSIVVIVHPPLVETWWFTTLMLIAFALTSYWLINFIKRYIQFSGFWKREKYVGKYKLEEKIGSGGMGTIYKAHDTLDKSASVAIKILREELFEDENYRKRFKQEAAIIDQLDHPNIVRVFERGQHQQKLFIVMELLKGEDLARKIEREYRIGINEIFDIMIQAADALVRIHAKNIVHRDLKPENIMLIHAEGRDNFVKLLDFGLARSRFQTRITQTGTVLGTVNYMAPEQIAHGEFSFASDIYSLGVIFYEAVTNQVPFPGDQMSEIMKQIMHNTPIPPIELRPEIPTRINALILQMMEKDNELRPTAREVLSKLKTYSASKTSKIIKKDR